MEGDGGKNLYQIVLNSPTNAFDFVGLWTQVAGTAHVWQAESGDTLYSLASKPIYGGNGENWRCLWPVSGTKDHGYPGKIWSCDKYDASNLATPSPSATSLDIEIDAGLVGSPTWISFTYYSTTNAAYQAIRDTSKEGDTPISTLRLDGHSCNTCNYLTGSGGTFSRTALETYASYAQTPTFSRAKDKKGPLRCWFSRDVHVWSLGCSSGHAFAPDFAKIIRSGGTVSGGNATVYSNPTDIWIGAGGAHHTSWASFITDTNWMHEAGTLN